MEMDDIWDFDKFDETGDCGASGGLSAHGSSPDTSDIAVNCAEFEKLLAQSKIVESDDLFAALYSCSDCPDAELVDHAHDHRMDTDTEVMSFQSDDVVFYDKTGLDAKYVEYRVTEQQRESAMFSKNFLCSLRYRGELERGVKVLLEAIEERKVNMRYASIARAVESMNSLLHRLLDRYSFGDLKCVELNLFSKYRSVNNRFPFKIMDPLVFGDLDVLESLAFAEIPVELDSRFRVLYDEEYKFDQWSEDDKIFASNFPVPISHLVKQGAVCVVTQRASVPICHCPIDWYVPFTDLRVASYALLKRFVPQPSSSVYRHMVTVAGPYVSIWESELSRKINGEGEEEEEEGGEKTRANGAEEGEEEGNEFGLKDVPLSSSDARRMPNVLLCSLSQCGELREKFRQQYAYIQLGKRLSRRLVRRARVAASVYYLTRNPDTLVDQAKKCLLFYEMKRHPPPGFLLLPSLCRRVLEAADMKWLRRMDNFIQGFRSSSDKDVAME